MTGTPFKIIPGFAVPFVHTHHPDSEPLNNELAKDFLEREKQGAVYANVNPSMRVESNLFESRFDLFRWDEPCIRQLREFCTAAIFSVVGELNGYSRDDLGGIRMGADAWFHIARRGGAFGLHNHPMASWSGIYCVDSGYPKGMEPPTGRVYFVHPAQNACMFADLGVANIAAPWAVRPRELGMRPGELVIFPSWLLHQVSPYLGDGVRITVAFNAWFRQRRPNERDAPV